MTDNKKDKNSDIVPVQNGDMAEASAPITIPTISGDLAIGSSSELSLPDFPVMTLADVAGDQKYRYVTSGPFFFLAPAEKNDPNGFKFDQKVDLSFILNAVLGITLPTKVANDIAKNPDFSRKMAHIKFLNAHSATADELGDIYYDLEIPVGSIQSLSELYKKQTIISYGDDVPDEELRKYIEAANSVVESAFGVKQSNLRFCPKTALELAKSKFGQRAQAAN